MGGQLWDRLTLGPPRRRRRLRRQLRVLDRLDRSEGTGPSSVYGTYSFSGSFLSSSYPPGAPYAPGDHAEMFSSVRAASLPAPPAPQQQPRRRVSFVVAAVAVLAAGGGAMLSVAPGTERLAAAPVVEPDVGSFAFMQERAGVPVTYNPCEPIRYVVNDDLAPAGGAALVADALGAVADATGLVFESEGRTDEPATPQRPARDVGRYGTGPSPVLIAWATPEQVPALAGGVVGIAGSMAEGFGGSTTRYITGTVYLDAAELSGILRRADGAAQVRAVITHELGHLVGLDHVDDPGELMYAANIGNTELGPGDRQGLAALGSGPCT